MSRRIWSLMFVVLALGCSAAAPAQPVVVKTIFPTDEVVIANAIVEPPTSASDDCTTAIQAAIDKVHGEGGGTVYLPAGRYRLAGRLFLRRDVTLRGDWAPPTTKGWQRGTVLAVTADKGNADARPAIRMLSNCGVRGLTIWYPEQRFDNPVAYPWSIGSATRDDDPQNPIPPDMNIAQSVIDVTLVNTYKGISIGTTSNLLHVIHNVYGTPLKTGITIDTCLDVGRTREVHFSAGYWANSGLPGAPSSASDGSTLRRVLQANATGFDIGRDEWGTFYRCSVDGYTRGMVFRTGYGATNGMVTECRMTQCGIALQLDDVCAFGIGFTGCVFGGLKHAVYAPQSYRGVVGFNSCDLRSPGESVVRADGSGTMTFQNCSVNGCGKSGLGMRLLDGDTSVLGSVFKGVRGGVAVEGNARRVILLGNRFGSVKPVQRNTAPTVDLQVSQARLTFDKPELSRLTLPPVRLPATRKLFVVTDFGADSTLDDNTQAFRRALDAARQAGGGTVYAPGGAYRFKGELVVPTGVELRGVHDVQHHTVGKGSALLPTCGKGDANGTPFIRLEPGSGLRGLTIWYPEQDPQRVTPYPWTIQGMGPRCWVVNVNCGNSYQGVDFRTHPSDGHVIRYLSGAYFRKGLFISKCSGKGWIDELQFNPHYLNWVDTTLNTTPMGDWPTALANITGNLEAISLGRCEDESVMGSFVFGAKSGIAFRSDGGGSNALVMHHGTDNGSSPALIESTGSRGVQFVGTVLTPVAGEPVAGIVVADGFTGKASFFNTGIFNSSLNPETPAAVVCGNGDVVIQQVVNNSGMLDLAGGKCSVESVISLVKHDWQTTVRTGCASARVLGCIAPTGVYPLKNEIGARLRTGGNSLSRPPAPTSGNVHIEHGWEDGAAATSPLFLNGVASAEASADDSSPHSGKRSLRVRGRLGETSGARYAYFKVFDTHVTITPDLSLSYWMKPLTPASRQTGIDLQFIDGSFLRNLGGDAHPNSTRGVVGEWTRIEVPIGELVAGKTIDMVLFAYDGSGSGDFDTMLDDLTIGPVRPGIPCRVSVRPGGGSYPGSVKVELKAEKGLCVRYTIDGTAPSSKSPIYSAPITLSRLGLNDLRYCASSSDGSLSGWVFGQLYDITPQRQ